MIDGFNESCNNIASSYLEFGNESMSVVFSWTTAKGNLPHLYYISHNLEPLETEFKTVSGSFAESFLFIDTQRGEEVINNRKYHIQIGPTIACTKIILESTKGVIQKYVKGSTKYCFLFESLLSSK